MNILDIKKIENTEKIYQNNLVNQNKKYSIHMY